MDHIDRMIAEDPSGTAAKVRELVRAVTAMEKSTGATRDCVKSVRAFDPPAPTPQELLRDAAVKLGWTQATINTLGKGGFFFGNPVIFLNPPEPKP